MLSLWGKGCGWASGEDAAFAFGALARCGSVRHAKEQDMIVPFQAAGPTC